MQKKRAAIRAAAIASCRAVWREAHPGTFDGDCPAKEKWIREETRALLPALAELEKHGFEWKEGKVQQTSSRDITYSIDEPEERPLLSLAVGTAVARLERLQGVAVAAGFPELGHELGEVRALLKRGR